jgi:hypothetical protein
MNDVYTTLVRIDMLHDNALYMQSFSDDTSNRDSSIAALNS